MEKEQLLKEKIEAYEWSWYIDSDIRGYEYFENMLDEIVQIIGAKEVKRFIGFDLFIGDGIEMMRIAGFSEFDNEGTEFELFYRDKHTNAKWYIKRNR